MEEEQLATEEHSEETMPIVELVDVASKQFQETTKMPEGPTIQSLQEEVQAQKDKALRAHAELENFRKRKDQELDTFKKYAHEKMVLELLPVLDSFDRACEHAQAQNQAQEMMEGFLLIQKQFHTVLEKCGVVPIEALQKPFDPNHHQAVLEEDVPDVEAGVVTKEMQKGYTLHQKVIRPSMVAVSK